MEKNEQYGFILEDILETVYEESLVVETIDNWRQRSERTVKTNCCAIETKRNKTSDKANTSIDNLKWQQKLDIGHYALDINRQTTVEYANVSFSCTDTHHPKNKNNNRNFKKFKQKNTKITVLEVNVRPFFAFVS